MTFSWVQSPWLVHVLDLALDRPRTILVGWTAVLLLASAGIARIQVDTSTNSFLDRDDPAWEVYQQSITQYGSDELLVVALEGETAWSTPLLAEVVRLSDSLQRIPGVRRVDSLATVPLIRTTQDGALRLDAGLVDGVPETPAEWAQYRAWLDADRLAPDSLVSDDGRVFALNVVLDENIVSDRSNVVAAVRAEVAGLRAWVTGVPVFRTDVNARTFDQILIFVPLTLLLVGGVLTRALRGMQPLVIAFSVGGLGAACGLGAMGVIGVPLSLTTTILPSLVLALGCAYSMHVLTASHGRLDAESLRKALGPVVGPIGLSGLTTVIGFLAMATIPIAAVRELATYGALGTFVALLASLSLAPAVMVLWPMKRRRTGYHAFIRGPLHRVLMYLVVRRRYAVIAGWAVLAIGGASGITRLFYATDIIQWFPRGTDVRDEYESVRSRLSGITPVNVMVYPSDPGSDGDVVGPEVLRAVDGLTSALQGRDDVGKALSIADPLRQIHAAMSGDPSAGLPGDRALIDQYLLLLESVDHTRDVLRADHTGGNILLRLDDNRSNQIMGLAAWVDAWWARHGVPGFSVTTTGIMYEFGRAEEQVARGQVQGLLLAFGIVGLILIAVFRDVRMTALGLAVNAIPLGVIYGALGLAGTGLDAGTACIGSTALGIGVDDTIHVLWGYRARRARGLAGADALDRCLLQILPALVLTTAMIGIGFLVLLLSPFTLLVNLGWVTTAIVLMCLLADVTLLPALLAQGAGEPTGRTRESETPPEPSEAPGATSSRAVATSMRFSR